MGFCTECDTRSDSKSPANVLQESSKQLQRTLCSAEIKSADLMHYSQIIPFLLKPVVFDGTPALLCVSNVKCKFAFESTRGWELTMWAKTAGIESNIAFYTDIPVNVSIGNTCAFNLNQHCMNGESRVIDCNVLPGGQIT